MSQFFSKKDSEKSPFEEVKTKGFKKKESMKNLKRSYRETSPSKEKMIKMKLCSIKTFQIIASDDYLLKKESKSSYHDTRNKPISLIDLDETSQT